MSIFYGSKYKRCPHCYPDHINHARIKIVCMIDDFIASPLRKIVMGILMLSENDFRPLSFMLHKLPIKILRYVMVVKTTNIIDRKNADTNTILFFDEACNRNLDLLNVAFRNGNTIHYMVTINKNNYCFLRNPIDIILQRNINYDDSEKYDDKFYFKMKLLEHSYPCPEGRVFISEKKAYQYGMQLGFPLVVKPVLSSLSHHVFNNIRSESDLKLSIRLAKQINCRVLVEKHITGKVYRAIIAGDKLIACAKRELGKVVGDGIQSIDSLLDAKNRQHLHGLPGYERHQSIRIKKDEHLVAFLATQGLTLNTILKDGQCAYLSNKVNRSNGAEITNVTDLVHQTSKQLLLEVHQLLNIPLSGLDFICEDISIPWNEQSFGIIENNSMPYIELHHFPTIGKPINVAGEIWDYVLSNIN